MVKSKLSKKKVKKDGGKEPDDKVLAKKIAKEEKRVKEKIPAGETLAKDQAPSTTEESEPGEVSAKEFGQEEDRPAGRDRYFEAVGRRKTAVARVRLFTKAGDFTVNNKPYGVYFPTADLQKIVEEALQRMKLFGRFRVSVKISGGGSHSQAEALRHGLARCLTKFNPDFRKRLKRAGFLRRDPRMKERKKFGLKKARKAPQWAKR